MDLLTALIWFSTLSFIYFGLGCFFSKFIQNEFVRYGLSNYRKMTGLLQLLGAFGLIFGFYKSQLLLLLAATGLFILMFLGFGVRLKIKDNFIKSSPSFFFGVLNLFIAIKTWMLHFI